MSDIDWGGMVNGAVTAIEGALGTSGKNPAANASVPNPTPQADRTVDAGVGVPVGGGAQTPVSGRSFASQYGLYIAGGAALFVTLLVIVAVSKR